MFVLRGLLGVAAVLALCWLCSANRRAINWRTVGVGLAIEFVFAIAVLKFAAIRAGFQVVSDFFVRIIGFADAGNKLIFGQVLPNAGGPLGYVFAVKALPVIIFFSALSSLLYYLGILQRIVYAFAWVMRRAMRLSGAESLSAAGNIFLGQTEAPLLIKPYLPGLTRSEVLAVMVGGMATIAGSVFAAYVGFLGGNDPAQQSYFAMHLLCASIMAAPAGLIVAKILLPQTEATSPDLHINPERIGTNALEAITNGAADGLRLAVNVGVMLLVFTSLMAMLNYLLQDVLGHHTGLNALISKATAGRYTGFSLQYLLGVLLAPLAWLLGVAWADCLAVGQLIGEKIILNEFIAYASLGGMKAAGRISDPHSIVIATYALCGFANIASIGIQVGGIGALAPNQRPVLASLGLRALMGGTAACCLTGAIAGMLTA